MLRVPTKTTRGRLRAITLRDYRSDAGQFASFCKSAARATAGRARDVLEFLELGPRQ